MEKIQPLRVIERIEHPRRDRDRATWPKGEWDQEPDLIEWRDAATGYPCLIVRGPLGSLCGYVGVPEGHPCHGKDYSAVEESTGVAPHGGLTYSDACAGNICHVPQPGEADNVWWLGFDCAHSGDVSPGLKAWRDEVTAKLRAEHPDWPEHDLWQETYKPIAYVQNECTELAAELKRIAG